MNYAIKQALDIMESEHGSSSIMMQTQTLYESYYWLPSFHRIALNEFPFSNTSCSC